MFRLFIEVYLPNHDKLFMFWFFWGMCGLWVLLLLLFCFLRKETKTPQILEENSLRTPRLICTTKS